MEVAKELLDAILSGNVEGVQGGSGEGDGEGDDDEEGFGGGDGPPIRRAWFGTLVLCMLSRQPPRRHARAEPVSAVGSCGEVSSKGGGNRPSHHSKGAESRRGSYDSLIC